MARRIRTSKSLNLLCSLLFLFLSVLLKTSRSRFRGQNLEFSLPFLATHYAIERHREALLWSFFVARVDQNLDGILSPSERRSLLDDLGYSGDQSPSDDLAGSVPFRSGLDGIAELYSQAGISLPGATTIYFDSRDGYAGFGAKRQAPGTELCRFEGRLCLGDGFLDSDRTISSTSLFTRNAFEHRDCGNCVIQLLLGRSGSKGLGKFLPRKNMDDDNSPSQLPPYESRILSVGKDWNTIDFQLPPSTPSASVGIRQAAIRREAVRLIQRYAYTLGESNSTLITMRNRGTMLATFRQLDPNFSPADSGRYPPPVARVKNPSLKNFPTFLALNDDFQGGLLGEEERINNLLGEFMASRWSEPSKFEARRRGQKMVGNEPFAA